MVSVKARSGARVDTRGAAAVATIAGAVAVERDVVESDAAEAVDRAAVAAVRRVVTLIAKMRQARLAVACPAIAERHVVHAQIAARVDRNESEVGGSVTPADRRAMAMDHDGRSG